MNRDEVRVSQQCRQVHEFDPHVTGPVLGDVGVVGHQAHPEGGGPLGHQGADLAQSDDAEHLAVQLDTLPLRALPLARDQRRVRLGNIARLRQDEGHRLLGRGEDVGDRRIHHHDPEFGGPRHVDVVESDSGPADHDKVATRFEGRRVHLGRRPDDERLSTHHRLEQFLGAQSEANVNVVPGPTQFVESVRGDLFGHEYTSHG